jgi:RES domain-containing protein
MSKSTTNTISGFESPKDWENFSSYLINHNRYVLKARGKRFLNAIRKTAAKRTHQLDKGMTLVRARMGSHEAEYEDEDGCPRIDFGPLSQSDLGTPPKDQAKEGRANPRGIPYLYLASRIETAIAEVRPWIKADVSVGYFKLTRRIKILDVSDDKPKWHASGFDFLTGEKVEWSFTQEELEVYAWGDINRAFSLPIQPGTEASQYIPTQYLAEYFKNHGYQGIAYRSSVDESGYNLVLFKPAFAKLAHARVFDISAIKYSFAENGNPYWVGKKRRKKKS